MRAYARGDSISDSLTVGPGVTGLATGGHGGCQDAVPDGGEGGDGLNTWTCRGCPTSRDRHSPLQVTPSSGHSERTSGCVQQRFTQGRQRTRGGEVVTGPREPVAHQLQPGFLIHTVCDPARAPDGRAMPGGACTGPPRHGWARAHPWRSQAPADNDGRAACAGWPARRCGARSPRTTQLSDRRREVRTGPNEWPDLAPDLERTSGAVVRLDRVVCLGAPTDRASPSGPSVKSVQSVVQGVPGP